MPPTPSSVEPSRQIRRFTALMIGLQAFSVLSILLVLLGFNYIVKVNLADLTQKSMRKAILAGDLRGAISVLDDIRTNYFDSIEYFDKNNLLVFSTPPRAEIESAYRHGPGNFRINYLIASDDNNAYPIGRIDFNFSVLNGMGYALLLAVFLIFGLMPVTNRMRRRLESRYNFELEARTNAAIAQTSQNLAHDIQNPLAIFEWAMRAKSWAEFEGMREGMASSINTIYTILADVGRKDAGLVLKRSRMTLDFASIVTDLTRILGNTSGAKLAGEGPDALPVNLDWIKIERVLANLVRNAAEAGARNIRLVGSMAANDLVLTVSDDGPGIPPEILGKLFQRGNTHGKDGGSGIGLYNVKAIIQAHGGKVNHLRENGLTIFKISLPDVIWDKASGELEAEKASKNVGEKGPITKPYALVILSDKVRENAIITAVKSLGIEARSEEDPEAWPMAFYFDNLDLVTRYPKWDVISTIDNGTRSVEREAKNLTQIIAMLQRQAKEREA